MSNTDDFNPKDPRSMFKSKAFVTSLLGLPTDVKDEALLSATAGLEIALTVIDLLKESIVEFLSNGGKRIEIQPREFRLLEHLLRHAGQVVTRTMLLEKVWDYHFDPQTNVIDVHVSRLRQKVDKGFDKPLIHTVRNAGYMIRAEA